MCQGKGECLGSQVPDASPNQAPGAGKALQLLSSHDPRPEGKGRSTNLMPLGAAAHVSQHQHPWCWAAAQRCQNTQIQHLQVAPSFSQPLLVPRLLDMRVSVRAHPHLGTSGHSTKSFQPAGPSPAAPPCATAAQPKGRCQHPALSQESRINVIYVPGKQQTSPTAKMKQKMEKKKSEKEQAQGLHQHTKLHQGSEMDPQFSSPQGWRFL